MKSLSFSYTLDNVVTNDLVTFVVTQSGVEMGRKNHVVTTQDAAGATGSETVDLLDSYDDTVAKTITVLLNGVDHSLTTSKGSIDSQIATALFFDGFLIGVK
jgi:hypothetical protein